LPGPTSAAGNGETRHSTHHPPLPQPLGLFPIAPATEFALAEPPLPPTVNPQQSKPRKDPELVTVGMNYNVLPGKGETFERAFAAVLEAMSEMEGHRQTRLYKEVADPNSYLIISDWESREQFDAFISSDRFRKVADWGKEQILAGRPRHEVYSR
jgi:heme-degrading monooxygenase HmoA